jgi:hypothetical protein
MSKETTYIYESPDGGKTIYRREFGESSREQIKPTEKEKEFWTCRICKRSTMETEYDYLAAHNLHLECALKEELMNKPDALDWEKKCPYCEAGL